MAKGIFEKLSEEYDIKVIFSSAGVGFCNGQPVSPNAVTVCNEIGVDISKHKARILREHDMNITDIFVVMTMEHAEIIMDLGIPKEKIYVLGGGIFDPYGSDLTTYRRCRNQIYKSLEDFCRILLKKQESETLKETNNE